MAVAKIIFLSFFSLLVFLPLSAQAAPQHGLSTFGDLKYPKDFKHFDYVNPTAPKGGTLATVSNSGLSSFNSLNGYILKGDRADGYYFIFDTLMIPAKDEPDALYGLVAKTADIAEDGMSVTFKLRPEARFSDGTALTSQDVVTSFTLLKNEGHPNYALSLGNVIEAKALGKYTVRYAFKETSTRDLPLIVARLPIFSKKFYETHTFNKTSLTAPIGSGPYKVSEVLAGRSITYERRKDYWAKDLNVNIGRYNFDYIKYEYFRDRSTQFEGLKAGLYDLREEFTSKTWATEYDVPQVKKGELIKLTLEDKRPSGAQGFFINTRRKKFSDIRVRKALDLAFDFAWTNKTLFHNTYKRTESYFENSAMKATGKPSEAERALLLPFKDSISSRIFTDEPYSPPVSDGSGQDRALLRKASALLDEAGWQIKSGRRVNKDGQLLTIEFLIRSVTFERIISPYRKSLQRLGIVASIRKVDSAQYETRQKNFNFDIISRRHVMRVTPGEELKNHLSSQAADVPGSFNLSGVKNPAIDAMIEKVISAKNRDELNTAIRAMDRIHRSGHYWIPHWYKAEHHIAYWNKFSRPKVKPAFGRAILDTWWYDSEKASALSSKK